jgi:hypothetical protein
MRDERLPSAGGNGIGGAGTGRKKQSAALSIRRIAVRRQEEGRGGTRTVPGDPAQHPDEEATMRFMVIVKATKESEAGTLPDEKILTAMGKYNEELARAGVLLAGEGLHPSSRGARVKFSGSKRTVVDGPFAQAEALVAGFWLFQVKSKEECIEWVKRCPSPSDGEVEIEIRQVFDPQDFGEAFTPDLQKQEEKIRETVRARSS